MNKLIKIINRLGGIDIEEIQNCLKQAQKKETSLIEKIQELRAINEQLNKQINDDKQYQQTRAQELEHKNELLENWQIKYESEIKSHSTTSAECEELRQQLSTAHQKINEQDGLIAELHQENDMLRKNKKTADSQNNSQLQELKETIASLKKEAENASCKWNETERRLQGENEGYKMKLLTQESRLKGLEQENATLKNELEQQATLSLQDKDSLRQQIENEKRTGKEQQEALKSRIEQLQQEYNQAKEIAAMQQNRAKAESDNLIAEKDEAIKRLEQTLESQDREHKTNERSWIQKLENAQKENVALKERLELKEHEFAKEKAEEKTQQEDFHAQIETLEKALDQGRKKYEEDRCKLLHEIETLKEEKAEAENRYQKTQIETEQVLQSELEHCKAETEILKATNKELQAALSAEQSARKNEQEVSGKEINIMREKLISMDIEAKDRQHQNDRLQSDYEALRDKLVILETEKLNFQHNETVLRRKLETTEAEIAKLKTSANSFTTRVTASAYKQEEIPFKGLPDNIRNMLLGAPGKNYARITCEPFMSQYILKTDSITGNQTELKGYECILKDEFEIKISDIVKITLCDTPYHDEQTCYDSGKTEDIEALQTKLADAIMNYRPAEIEYANDKGLIRKLNICWISYLPLNEESPSLPNEQLFQSLLNDEVNPEYIIAYCPETRSNQIFELKKIKSVRQYAAFVTNEAGINALASGLYYAVRNEQVALAELIYANMPSVFRDDPYVVSNYAHCNLLKGDFRQARELYLSIAPDEKVDGSRTWNEVIESDFESFAERDIEVDQFIKMAQELSLQGWNFS